MAKKASPNNIEYDATKHCVLKCLLKMHKNGEVERRMSSAGVLEYRLKQWSKKGKTYEARVKHDAYHKGYVLKSDFSQTRLFAKVTGDLVLRGILVAEPDGNFTLNPNIKTEQARNECT